MTKTAEQIKLINDEFTAFKGKLATVSPKLRWNELIKCQDHFSQERALYEVAISNRHFFISVLPICILSVVKIIRFFIKRLSLFDRYL